MLPLAIAVAGTANAAEEAAAKCSAATLQGTCLYSYTGAMVSGKDRWPFSYAGYAVYDGHGHLSAG